MTLEGLLNVNSIKLRRIEIASIYNIEDISKVYIQCLFIALMTTYLLATFH